MSVLEDQPREVVYVTERSNGYQIVTITISMAVLLWLVTITVLDKYNNLSRQLHVMQTTCAEAKLVKDK